MSASGHNPPEMVSVALSLGTSVSAPAPVPDFEEIYTTYFDFVWRALRRLGVPEASTDDALQDVFLVVHRRRASFEGRSSLRTWIYGIVLRVARDHRRRRLRKDRGAPLEQEPVDPRAGPAELAAQREALRVLDRLLDELGDEKRELFVLAEIGELTVPEIAELLGLNLNTAYSRLRAARAAFATALREHRAREAREEDA